MCGWLANTRWTLAVPKPILDMCERCKTEAGLTVRGVDEPA